MASSRLSRSLATASSTASSASCPYRFLPSSSSASTSTASFHPLALSPSPSSFSRRSLSTTSISSSAKKRLDYIPKTKTSSLISFKSKPNMYYPQNQFQPDVNKTADGEDRQQHKKAFEGAFFVASAAGPESIPKKGKLQEILFAGRSNTGKSTLLNAILSSETLVKTSSKPGHTKMLNFFEVPNQLVFVDAPGYGERGRPEWGDTFQYYLTHRPPSPPSLIISLFTLSHKLSQSDLYFLASLPPSIPLLPVFTKTDLCPVVDIAAKKKQLNNEIQAARESAYVEAVARENRKRMARLGEEFEGWNDEDGVKQEKKELEKPTDLVKGKTWEGMCTSTKRGWVMRDKTIDAVRSAILSQLQSTLATDLAHREHHLRTLALRRTEIKTIANGDRVESARLFGEMNQEREQAMEDFFASVPGAASTSETSSDRQRAYGEGGARGQPSMDEEEEQAEAWEEERRRAARGIDGPVGVEDPFVGSAFGRTKRTKGRSTRNWARAR